MEKKLKYEQHLDLLKAGLVLKIISCYFIFLFVYTGFSKLIDNQSLFTALRNAPLFLQTSFAAFLSWLVPIAEILLAVMLSFKNQPLRMDREYNSSINIQHIHGLDCSGKP